MVGFVKLMGIVIVVMGTVYLVKPSIMKRVTRFCLKENRLYWAGAVNVFIGIICLFTAAECEVTWFIVLIGLLALAKGVAAIALGPKKMAPKLEAIIKQPAKTIRALGVVGIAIGVLIIYSV